MYGIRSSVRRESRFSRKRYSHSAADKSAQTFPFFSRLNSQTGHFCTFSLSNHDQMFTYRDRRSEDGHAHLGSWDPFWCGEEEGNRRASPRIRPLITIAPTFFLVMR